MSRPATTPDPDAPVTELDPATVAAVAASEREHRIIVGLAACVEAKGFAATTMADIAREAGVSKSALYVHFDSKLDCMLVLYERATAALHAALRATAERPDVAELPWRERTRSLLVTYLRAVASSPAFARSSYVDMQAAGDAALALRRKMVGAYVDLLAEFAEELRRGAPDEVRAVDRATILAAAGGVNEILLTYIERGAAADLPEAADDVTRFFVALLERRPSDG